MLNFIEDDMKGRIQIMPHIKIGKYFIYVTRLRKYVTIEKKIVDGFDRFILTFNLYSDVLQYVLKK
jgi:hypothetical protein